MFPRLSVAGNVSYGLKELPVAEAVPRLAETVHWLGLDDLERRYHPAY